MVKQKVKVLFHAQCFDGFAAAYSAWKHFRDQTNVDASYIPVTYYQAFPLSDEEIKESIIYIIDFSYNRNELLRVKSLAQKLLILDHHKTAQEDLDGLNFAVFDMEKSGAMLSWNYFHKKGPVPLIIQYVQDRDLWTWKLPKSQEINSVIQSLSIENTVSDFKEFEKYEERIESNFENIVAEGSAILASIKKYVQLAIDRGVSMIEISGYKIPAVNTCVFESEIGNKLLSLYPNSPFSATYYKEANGDEKWSLRGNGKVDVGAIAKTFGGGGHRDASGFRKTKK